MDGVRDAVPKDVRLGRQVALVWLFETEADVVDRVHELDVPLGALLGEAELVAAAKRVLAERLEIDDPEAGDLLYVVERSDGSEGHFPGTGDA